MPPDVPDSLRKLVSDRAGGRCEYCGLPEAVCVHRHEPDHIVPRQHGGETAESNLALACMWCNRHKGPNVGSFDPETGELVRLFNPRIDEWSDHFTLERGTIRPLTPQGRVTVVILCVNDEARAEERRRLVAAGSWV